MEKLKTAKQLLDNKDKIMSEASPIIDSNLCDQCRKKLIRGNLLHVPIWKVFNKDYHRQIDKTLCRKCKIRMQNAFKKTD